MRIKRQGWLKEVPLSYLPQTKQREKPRTNPPKIPLDRRTGISEVEMVYDEATACEQAHRCLKCHIQTVFDSNICILCGGCVDVCPKNCLKLVPVEAIEGSEAVHEVVCGRLGKEPGVSLQSRKGSSGRGTAMIKDETLCIRCGLCARRCPTKAITMEAFYFEEKLINNREGKTA